MRLKQKKCKICGESFSLPKYNAWRAKYCSPKCRNKAYNKKNYAYQIKRNRAIKDAIAKKPAKNKIQCLICGQWYRQVGSHIAQRHKMTSREYRKQFGFDVKKGQLPKDLREVKSEQAITCGGYKNLKNGKKFWFKRNDPKAGHYERSEQTLKRLRVGNKRFNVKKLKKCIVCKKKLVGRQYKYCCREHRIKDYKHKYYSSKAKLF